MGMKFLRRRMVAFNKSQRMSKKQRTVIGKMSETQLGPMAAPRLKAKAAERAYDKGRSAMEYLKRRQPTRPSFSEPAADHNICESEMSWRCIRSREEKASLSRVDKTLFVRSRT